MTSSATFPRALRLRKSRDFARLERQGTRVSSSLLIMLVRPPRTQPHATHTVVELGRVGFTVSKKVGNAVVRNHVKRRLRERMRQQQAMWRGHDIVLIARPEASGADTHALWQAVDGLLLQLPGLLHAQAPRGKHGPHKKS
jgi:ribonuclease P protein component